MSKGNANTGVVAIFAIVILAALVVFFLYRGGVFTGGGKEDVNVELKVPSYSAVEDDAVGLNMVMVTAKREGQASAIMERRAAINAKNVVSADNYGALTMGDVGEFMKSMPGISLDYTEVDATAVRIGGLDPKYSTFTIDGARMATATSNNNTGRQNSFEQMSITGIESIELTTRDVNVEALSSCSA